MKNLNKRLIPYIEKSKEGIAVFAREGASLQLQYANATLARMLGYERETLVSNLKDTALQLFYPEDRSLLLREINLLSMRGGNATPFTLRLLHKTGEVLWVRITFRQVGIQGRGEPFSFLVEDLSDQMHDTSILKKTQDQLSFALNHNLLTGLYTRQHFNEVCRNYLDSHSDTRCTLVY